MIRAMWITLPLGSRKTQKLYSVVKSAVTEIVQEIIFLIAEFSGNQSINSLRTGSIFSFSTHYPIAQHLAEDGVN